MVLASLRASEAVIYGRFGYGLAGLAADHELDRRGAGFPPRAAELAGRGTVRLIEAGRALEVIPPIYERAARWRAGAIGRIDVWWRRLYGRLGDASDTSARWVAVHTDDDGVADGYVDYERAPSGAEIEVRDLFAAGPVAYAALWRHVLDLDLVTTVRAARRPLDEGLRWLLADSRALRVTGVADEQWARLLDVAAALAARTYAPVADRVVLAIEDPLLAENSGRFAVDGSGAAPAAATEPTDLTMGVAEAGATYLGGTSFAALAAGGRLVEERPGAAAAADRLFACRPLPWCGTFF
jgi:predicted acetyltransferase